LHGATGTAPVFLVVLTHGAGGLPGTADILAARDAAVAAGGAVALVTQPYRVKGARAPGSSVRQDEAWTEIVAALRARVPGAASVIVGGRSNGARVACRTAQAVGACGVIALAFPLRPPWKPEDSRVEELRQLRTAGIPVLVVNGDRDPFGIPESADADRVVVVPGETHAMKGHTAAVRAAIAEWLTEVVA
jgi:uncharacterized protein